MKKLMMLAAAILAVQALPALAEEGGKDGHKGKFMEKMFADQDTDGNGSVSESEFQAFSKKRFDAMDGNKDGSLTKEEIKAHHEAKRAEWKAKKEQMKKDAPAEAPKAE